MSSTIIVVRRVASATALTAGIFGTHYAITVHNQAGFPNCIDPVFHVGFVIIPLPKLIPRANDVS